MSSWRAGASARPSGVRSRCSMAVERLSWTGLGVRHDGVALIQERVLYANLGFPIYASQIEYLGGTAAPYRYLPTSQGYAIDLDKVRASITPNPEAIIYNDLQNPIPAESTAGSPPLKEHGQPLHPFQRWCQSRPKRPVPHLFSKADNADLVNLGSGPTSDSPPPGEAELGSPASLPSLLPGPHVRLPRREGPAGTSPALRSCVGRSHGRLVS